MEELGDPQAGSGQQAPMPVAPPATADALRAMKLRSAWNGAAVWFFMIAGLTVANGVFWYLNTDTRMVLGLVSTRLATGLIIGLGTLGLIIEGVLVVGAAAVVAVLGFFVRKQRMGALIAGIAILVADTIVFVAAAGTGNFIDIALRVFAISVLVGSVRLIRAGGEVPKAIAPSRGGSLVAGYLALAGAAAFLCADAFLVVNDLSFARDYGAPGTGSWGLSFTIYGLAAGVALCLLWVGLRVLHGLRKSREAADTFPVG